MRVLGIDLGAKRIGVAISDSDGRVATPIEVVERTGDSGVHRRRIAALAVEWGVTGLVVGLPLSLDGQTGPAAQAASEEADALAATTGLPVELYDERFTTVSAKRQLRGQHLDARGRRQVVDKVAAAIMLQAWLDGRLAAQDVPTSGSPSPDPESTEEKTP